MGSSCSFDSLIKNSTLAIIYSKFKDTPFTAGDVVTRLYWLGCIEKHVQYMQQKGWIVLGPDKKFRFVVPVKDWQ